MPPRLKQFRDLTARDFETEPLWVACHGLDEVEAWYPDTDEETFRPWTGDLPVSPSDGMFLVAARFHLADGSVHHGFLTPTFDDAELPRALGQLQPQLFAPTGERIGLWLGMFPSSGPIEAAYQVLQRPATKIFPIRFTAQDGLSKGLRAGELHGFYSTPGGLNARVEIHV